MFFTTKIKAILFRFHRPNTAWIALLGTFLAAPLQSSNALAETVQRVSHALFENVQSYVLANGLHVMMAPRESSDSVMLQLVVNVGLRDFPCDKQQIPHVIEHLLFENNTRYGPEELRNKIRDLGGFSNGWTTDENTLISVSIHSDYEKEALETLLTMVQDLRWDERDMPRVKRIVDSEIETPVSPIQRWYDSKRSVVEIAKGRLYPNTTLECVERSAAEPLTMDEIQTAYKAHYYAANMTLIVIGNLSSASRDWVETEFGKLPASSSTTAPYPRFRLTDSPVHNEPLEEKGGYGSAQAWVNLLTRMPGSDDADYAAAQILTEYFNETLYAQVRLKYGLGYTPNAFMASSPDISELVATTKTRSDLYQIAQQIFEKIYQDLRTQPIPESDLQRLKRKLILKFEAKEREALDIAELYRLYRHQIRENGKMPNLIEQYQKVSAADIKRVTTRYFPEQPLLAILRPPSPMEAALAVSGIILGAAVLGWPFNLWIQRRRHQRTQERA